ncbi:type II/IV secretion system protein [Oscillibacter hominis]|uniref:Type II/IV secretion system protein n=1 Tax=Oscillibacter hominis TaxID=2763056 RepID=A0A7G9B6Q9_9FIRM|nr:GspE/PulE family protein [Oscillibacter hominis]QNL45240.1 type II/IV secretion system protein [Oscillibacter hominis]
MAYTRLGDLLKSVNLITDEQLSAALENQKKTKRRLGEELIAEHVITEQQFIEALEMQLGVEFIDLSQISIPPQMAEALPRGIAKKYALVPVRLNQNTLYIAMTDPLNFMAIEEVKTATRHRVVPMIATSEAVSRAIASLYGNEGAARAIEEMQREMRTSEGGRGPDPFQANEIGDDARSAPTVRLVNSIIERAISERASDIHLEPEEGELRVRMRIDGLMRAVMSVPKALQSSVISRLKIMGGMDITERKVPQDGRANVRIKQSDVDLRMSTLPTIYGEKFVIRLLDKSARLLDKSRIGLTGEDLGKYERLLRQNSGVILIVGPTGSGKSSTMYTMIRELNTEQVNLVTLEDPVEYNIAGINQVQINEKTGMTFAGGLRAILRQDPDIIAVGEIRDGETAQIAMRAALTGHLVLSTIHTNDAISTVERLLDIGVEPYLIASALSGVISQRLVRRICPECREEYQPSEEELADMGLPPDTEHRFCRGKGCPACFGTGYRGRTGVFELLVVDRKLRSAISDGIGREELAALVRREGKFTSLADNCRRLVLEGVTTIEEARRITNSADYDYES